MVKALGLLFLLVALTTGIYGLYLVVGTQQPEPVVVTTTLDTEYARCMAIVTHQEVLRYRDLETARYLADVACNDGKVRIP